MGGWHGTADHSVPGCRPAPGGGDRCGTVCRRKHRRQIAAVSTSARRPGGRIDRGRATGLPVASIRLRRRERTDGPRTPMFAKIPGLGTTFKMLTKVWPLGRGTVSVSGNDIVVE